MLNVVVLSVIMMSVVMLSVVLLSVVARTGKLSLLLGWQNSEENGKLIVTEHFWLGNCDSIDEWSISLKIETKWYEIKLNKKILQILFKTLT